MISYLLFKEFRGIVIEKKKQLSFHTRKILFHIE